MRPWPEEVLRAIQAGITAHFAPELTSNYARSQFAFGMMLFGIAQRDYDTAVPDLLENNRTLRSLLSDASSALHQVSRPDARAAIHDIAALPAPTDSLRLSDLRRENDALRAAIGRLAPLIEPAGDADDLAPLRPVRKALYAHLSADAAKRMVPILSGG